tara:strand:+ start:1437 stop:1562 length:126 start_codon:yes stop_codon:yes gene_type:complete
MKIAIIVSAILGLGWGAIKYLERQRQKEVYAKALKVLNRRG